MGQHCVPGAGLEYHVEWDSIVCLEQVLSIMLSGAGLCAWSRS